MVLLKLHKLCIKIQKALKATLSFSAALFWERKAITLLSIFEEMVESSLEIYER